MEETHRKGRPGSPCLVPTVCPQCRHLCPSALHPLPPTHLPTAHTQPGPRPLLRNGALWGALKRAKPAGHGRGAWSQQSEDPRTASGNGTKDSPASQTWAASNSKPFSDSCKMTLFFSSANEPSPAWPPRRRAGAGAHSPAQPPRHTEAATPNRGAGAGTAASAGGAEQELPGQGQENSGARDCRKP